MGNKNPCWERDDSQFQIYLEKVASNQDTELIETPGSPDPLQIISRQTPIKDIQQNEYEQVLATADPTADILTFRMYLAKLNRLIKGNMPFLSATFKIAELSISIVLSGGFLPDALKEAFFDCKVSKTSVIVQYTLIPEPGAKIDLDVRELVKIRKFGSVTQFMDATRSLDDVLLNIQSLRRSQIEVENH